jgi:hypothetical protein
VITELNIADNNLADYGTDMSGVVALADVIPDMGALTKFDISKNKIRAAGSKALAAGLKGNQVITELSIADNQLGWDAEDMSGIVALADVIPDMGAISSANLLMNDIDTNQAKALVLILKEHPTLKSLCGNSGDETELHMSGEMNGAGEAIMLAPEIAGNGALTSLHVGQNNIPAKEMREIMGIAMHMDSMKILCEVPFKDKTLTELDVSGKNLGMEGALVVAGYLDGNGAITKFTFSGDESWSPCVTMETTMTEAKFSGKALGVSGSMMVAAFLPKCQ